MLISRRWAWQHPERSRHLDSDDELDPQTGAKANANVKTGKPKPKPKARTRRSLKAHLEDLHSLLRSTYFSSWPLRVRFFRADVYGVWRLWNDRVAGRLPDNIKIILDGDNVAKASDAEQDDGLTRVGSINNLSVDYSRIEDYLEKSMFMLEDLEDLQCGVCKQSISPETEQIVVCPRSDCRGTSHLLCLSTKFLDAVDEPDLLVPAQGTCPSCENIVQWPTMMRELSFRNRAEKEARTILKRKEKRVRKESAAVDASSGLRSSSIEPRSVAEDDLGPDWYEGVDLESDSDFEGRQKHRPTQPPSKLEIVIEDSDWDDAELVE
jgi:structure-specific endonuclease subunit SLX1